MQEALHSRRSARRRFRCVVFVDEQKWYTGKSSIP